MDGPLVNFGMSLKDQASHHLTHHGLHVADQENHDDIQQPQQPLLLVASNNKVNGMFLAKVIYIRLGK